MDARDLFLMLHAAVHAGGVSGAKSPTLADRTFADLTEAQLRLRPAAAVNSCAWLLWHMARAEDAIVGLLLLGQPQVYDDAWRKQLGVDRLDIGTGMNAEEVTALGEAIDVTAARAYRDAVGRRTRELVAAMPAEAWEGRVTPEAIRRATDAGAFIPRVAEAMERLFTGRPRAALLGGIAVSHSSQHIGEAQTVRSLGGFGL
jgi:hypothetical protein